MNKLTAIGLVKISYEFGNSIELDGGIYRVLTRRELVKAYKDFHLKEIEKKGIRIMGQESIMEMLTKDFEMFSKKELRYLTTLHGDIYRLLQHLLYTRQISKHDIAGWLSSDEDYEKVAIGKIIEVYDNLVGELYYVFQENI